MSEYGDLTGICPASDPEHVKLLGREANEAMTAELERRERAGDTVLAARVVHGKPEHVPWGPLLYVPVGWYIKTEDPT